MWPILCAEKSLIESIENLIDNHKDILEQKKIYIWGAGVRGTVLGLLMEQNGLMDYEYIDGDPEKQGKSMSGHFIVSSECLEKNNEFIIISIEQSEDVVILLKNMGYSKEKDYIVLKTTESKGYMEMIRNIEDGDNVVIGGSIFNAVGLSEQNKSLVDMILKMQETKPIVLNCLSLGVIFYTLKLLYVEYKKSPHKVIVFLSREMVSDVNHKLSRTQKVEILEKIYNQFRKKDYELEMYIQEAKVRAQNTYIEKCFSPVRGDDSEDVIVDSKKKYCMDEIMTGFEEKNESINYMKRIISITKAYHSEICFVWEPFNYEENKRYFGNGFSNIMQVYIDKLKKIIGDENMLFDWSDLLNEQYFISLITINDALTFRGIEVVANEIRKLIEVKNDNE